MGSPYAEHVNVTFSFSSIIVDIGCDVKEGGSIDKKRNGTFLEKAMVNQQILLEDKVSLFFVENDSSPSNFQPLKMGRHVQKINISDC